METTKEFSWTGLVLAVTSQIDTAKVAKLSREEVQAQYKGAIVAVGAYSTKDMLLKLVRINLQSISITWLKCAVDGNHPDGYLGYQSQLPVKANAEKGIEAKSGCLEAIAYNAFTAWAKTNVHAETGALLSGDDKTKSSLDAKTAETNKQNADIQNRIDNAVSNALKGTIDASLLILVTVESSIEFLLAHGFTQNALKNGTVTLTMKK